MTEPGFDDLDLDELHAAAVVQVAAASRVGAARVGRGDGLPGRRADPRRGRRGRDRGRLRLPGRRGPRLDRGPRCSPPRAPVRLAARPRARVQAHRRDARRHQRDRRVHRARRRCARHHADLPALPRARSPTTTGGSSKLAFGRSRRAARSTSTPSRVAARDARLLLWCNPHNPCGRSFTPKRARRGRADRRRARPSRRRRRDPRRPHVSGRDAHSARVARP